MLRRPRYRITPLPALVERTVRVRVERIPLRWWEIALNGLAIPALALMGTFEFSRFGAQMALDQVFGRTQGPAARSVYVALASSAPAEDETVTTFNSTHEIATTGYTRQAYGPTAPTAADPTEIHNTATITFGPFTADPPNVTHFGIVSSSSGTAGDYLGWGAWTAARDAASGDSLQIGTAGGSNLSITLT